MKVALYSRTIESMTVLMICTGQIFVLSLVLCHSTWKILRTRFELLSNVFFTTFLEESVQDLQTLHLKHI